jgi:antitoxin ParD1/3/4
LRKPLGAFIFVYIEYGTLRTTVAQTTTMTVRLSGPLSEFVAENVGENGSYENVSEYIRDLIRRDKARAEREGFERLKAELAAAFAAPESTYEPLTAAEVIGRNQR